MKDPLSEMSWYSSTHEWATASGANRTKAKSAGSRAHMVEHLVDAVGRCIFEQYDETGRVVWVWGTVCGKVEGSLQVCHLLLLNGLVVVKVGNASSIGPAEWYACLDHVSVKE